MIWRVTFLLLWWSVFTVVEIMILSWTRYLDVFAITFGCWKLSWKQRLFLSGWDAFLPLVISEQNKPLVAPWHTFYTTCYDHLFPFSCELYYSANRVKKVNNKCAPPLLPVNLHLSSRSCYLFQFKSWATMFGFDLHKARMYDIHCHITHILLEHWNMIFLA